MLKTIATLACLFTVQAVCAKTLLLAPEGYIIPQFLDFNLRVKSVADASRFIAPGDTLLIAGGVYREAFLLPRKNWSIKSPTIIKPLNKERVVIKGSDLVKDWVRRSGGLYSKSWSAGNEPQQVFVNGLPLQQMGGTIFGGYPLKAGHPLSKLHASEGGIWPGRKQARSDLPPHSFYFDSAHKELVINLGGGDANVADIEVCTRPSLFDGEGVHGLRIEEIEFEHANTSFFRRGGAVRLKGNGNVLSRIKVRWADAIGVHLVGDDNLLTESDITSAGQLGISVRGKGNHISKNFVAHNNLRGFNKYWEAGGIKAVGEGSAHQTVVEENVFAYNRGDGIWFDWLNTESTIRNNLVAFNDGFGVHYEASQSGKIIGNTLVGNLQRGIYIFQSWDTVAVRNLVIGNGLEGVVVIGSKRKTVEADLSPRNNLIGYNVIAWNKNPQIILPPDVNSNISNSNLFIGATPTSFSLGWPSIFKKIWNTLEDWHTKSGNDGDSNVVVRNMTRAQRNAKMERRLDYDWFEDFGNANLNIQNAPPSFKDAIFRRLGETGDTSGVKMDIVKSVLDRAR